MSISCTLLDLCARDGVFVVRCRPTVCFLSAQCCVQQADGLEPVLGSILPRPGLLGPALEDTERGIYLVAGMNAGVGVVFFLF